MLQRQKEMLGERHDFSDWLSRYVGRQASPGIIDNCAHDETGVFVYLQ